MLGKFAILLLLLTLTSCVTLTPPASSTPIPWKDRELALNRLQSWQLNGKIALQTNQDAGSATVEWLQNNSQYTISLFGPLGTQGLKLTGQPGSVWLQTADGKRYNASSPEQLLAQKWRWDLPVSYLHYWIRGLPVPTIAKRSQFDNFGRLSRLIQQNWDVQFLSYANASGVDLPNKIFITTPTLKVKVIVYQWRVL